MLADLVSKGIWAKRVILSSMVAVLLIGVICGLSTRGTGYRSDQVAVLRVIADKIERDALGCVRFDIDLSLQSRWQNILRILSRGKLRECGGGSGGVIIRQDHLGFPYVAASQP